MVMRKTQVSEPVSTGDSWQCKIDGTYARKIRITAPSRKEALRLAAIVEKALQGKVPREPRSNPF